MTRHPSAWSARGKWSSNNVRISHVAERMGSTSETRATPWAHELQFMGFENALWLFTGATVFYCSADDGPFRDASLTTIPFQRMSIRVSIDAQDRQRKKNDDWIHLRIE